MTHKYIFLIENKWKFRGKQFLIQSNERMNLACCSLPMTWFTIKCFTHIRNEEMQIIVKLGEGLEAIDLFPWLQTVHYLEAQWASIQTKNTQGETKVSQRSNYSKHVIAKNVLGLKSKYSINLGSNFKVI